MTQGKNGILHLCSPTLRFILALWEGITEQDIDNHTQVPKGLGFGGFLLPNAVVL